jgi:uncharacterized protein (DUF2267 family)
MSHTGLQAIDRTVHEANEWLKDLMYEMGWEDRQLAYKGLRAALHALRDRLIPEEAAHLGAQLPMLIRGIYYEGWSPAKTPEKIRDKNAFLERVQSKLDGETTAGRTDPETLTRAVFKLLRHRISEGEVRDIESGLPQELADLWPRAPEAGR